MISIICETEDQITQSRTESIGEVETEQREVEGKNGCSNNRHNEGKICVCMEPINDTQNNYLKTKNILLKTAISASEKIKYFLNVYL